MKRGMDVPLMQPFGFIRVHACVLDLYDKLTCHLCNILDVTCVHVCVLDLYDKLTFHLCNILDFIRVHACVLDLNDK